MLFLHVKKIEMNISVIIPLLNEEESLPELEAWIRRVMTENNYSYEIVFVDDGSTDGTAAICDRCAYLDGEPCRYPERMHPCLESHGINLIPTLENLGLEYQYGGNVVTWFSLLFF